MIVPLCLRRKEVIVIVPIAIRVYIRSRISIAHTLLTQGSRVNCGTVKRQKATRRTCTVKHIELAPLWKITRDNSINMFTRSLVPNYTVIPLVGRSRS